jgi:hypothetical protein
MIKVEICPVIKPLALLQEQIKERQQEFLAWQEAFPTLRFKFSTDGRKVVFYEDRDLTTFCMSYKGKYKIIDKK